MGRPSGVSDIVLRHLSKHRNTELHLDDIAADTGLDRQQVSNAIAHLRSGGTVRVDKPRRGWYVFRGTSVATNGHGSVVPHKAKAEVIALLADGRLLVSVEGMVYVAAELDIEH